MVPPVTTPSTRSAREQACLDAARRLTALMRGGGAPWLELDLTMAQLKAMMALSALGPLSVGRLGRRLGIAEPAASLLVDKLHSQDLVARRSDPSDRRRILVELSENAQALVARLQEVRDERLVELLSELDDDDLLALEQGIQALVRAAANERTAADSENSDDGTTDAEAEA
jgi:DNA-binding MarR family transcriptional regulator